MCDAWGMLLPQDSNFMVPGTWYQGTRYHQVHHLYTLCMCDKIYRYCGIVVIPVCMCLNSRKFVKYSHFIPVYAGKSCTASNSINLRVSPWAQFQFNFKKHVVSINQASLFPIVSCNATIMRKCMYDSFSKSL